MARVKINIYMCVATFFGALGAIWVGKRDREKGVSLQRMNLDWHQEIRTQADKEKSDNNSSVS